MFYVAKIISQMNKEENNVKISSLKIISVLLIIFTIIYFTCFGCFLVLNDAGTRTAQTVTLNSEGPAGEMYPDSMGEYQLAGEESKSTWYKHIERQDRFIMYNKLGNIHSIKNIVILYISPLDYRWYITHTNDTEIVEGDIRSVLSGRNLFPELEWEYLTVNITECTTVG